MRGGGEAPLAARIKVKGQRTKTAWRLGGETARRRESRNSGSGKKVEG